MNFDNNITPYSNTNYGFYYPVGETMMFSHTPIHPMDIMGMNFELTKIIINCFNLGNFLKNTYLNPYANVWYPEDQENLQKYNEEHQKIHHPEIFPTTFEHNNKDKCYYSDNKISPQGPDPLGGVRDDANLCSNAYLDKNCKEKQPEWVEVKRECSVQKIKNTPNKVLTEAINNVMLETKDRLRTQEHHAEIIDKLDTLETSNDAYDSDEENTLDTVENIEKLTDVEGIRDTEDYPHRNTYTNNNSLTNKFAIL